MKKHTLLAGLAGILCLLLIAPAVGAQDKVQQCSNIQISVDRNKGPGNWDNGIAVLHLHSQGQGWTTKDGKHIQAQKGQSYRLNFSDGSHMVNVSASSGGGSTISVKGGSREAIVLVDITGASGRGAVNFEIKGSPNPNAKINGCPGGNLYFDIGG